MHFLKWARHFDATENLDGSCFSTRSSPVEIFQCFVCQILLCMVRELHFCPTNLFAGELLLFRCRAYLNASLTRVPRWRFQIFEHEARFIIGAFCSGGIIGLNWFHFCRRNSVENDWTCLFSNLSKYTLYYNIQRISLYQRNSLTQSFNASYPLLFLYAFVSHPRLRFWLKRSTTCTYIE